MHLIDSIVVASIWIKLYVRNGNLTVTSKPELKFCFNAHCSVLLLFQDQKKKEKSQFSSGSLAWMIHVFEHIRLQHFPQLALTFAVVAGKLT